MITVGIKTVLIYVFLLFTERIMGKRQLGELEISELIVTLMVSELAVVPIHDNNVSVIAGMVPIILLLGIEMIISKLITVSQPLKKFFCGTPSILICRGVIDEAELKRSRIGVDELLSSLRQNGCGHIEDVEYAIIESNGKLSVIQKSYSVPPSAKDLDIKVKETGISHSIIINGKINKRSMFQANISEEYVERILKSKGIEKEKILLLTIDDSGKTSIITKEYS